MRPDVSTNTRTAIASSEVVSAEKELEAESDEFIDHETLEPWPRNAKSEKQGTNERGRVLVVWREETTANCGAE